MIASRANSMLLFSCGSKFVFQELPLSADDLGHLAHLHLKMHKWIPIYDWLIIILFHFRKCKHELIKWIFQRGNYLIMLTYIWPTVDGLSDSQQNQCVLWGFVLCCCDQLELQAADLTARFTFLFMRCKDIATIQLHWVTSFTPALI